MDTGAGRPEQAPDLLKHRAGSAVKCCGYSPTCSGCLAYHRDAHGRAGARAHTAAGHGRAADGSDARGWQVRRGRAAAVHGSLGKRFALTGVELEELYELAHADP